jgi:hypothetical protein
MLISYKNYQFPFIKLKNLLKQMIFGYNIYKYRNYWKNKQIKNFN